MFKIENTHIFNIGTAIRAMRNPMSSQRKTDSLIFEDDLLEFGTEDERLAKTLSGVASGTGHDSFTKSILVSMDITADHSWLIQEGRYHFIDIASSESKMHSITKGDISGNCNALVSISTINMVNRMITLYNETEGWGDSVADMARSIWNLRATPKTRGEFYEAIIFNTPIGYELTANYTTNYLQLKTMYAQRKNHKMSSWSVGFKEWVESLPYSFLITGEPNE